MNALDISALLADCEALGIQLWTEDGQLRYRAPNGVMDDTLKQRLREHKNGLLALLAPQEVQVQADPRHQFEPFILTDVQAAYLVGRSDAYDYGGVGCHGYVELDGPGLDPKRLELAWHTLILRHPMLRAVIAQAGFQQVQQRVRLPPLVCNDLRGHSASQEEQALLATRTELANRVYCADTWPLYELRLSQRDQGSRVHLSIDLLIADFVSIQCLLCELDQLYHEPEQALPELQLTFRDILLAERAARDAPAARARRERDRDYWLQRLPTLPDAPELPLLEQQQPGTGFDRHALYLDSRQWQGFCQQAAELRLTPSAAVLAVFAETLGHWSRRPHFSLSVTVLRRPPYHPDIGRIVGDFTAINVLAVEPPGASDFNQRAQALQQRLWQDLEHEAFSGVEVLRERARLQSRSLLPVVFTSTLGVGDNRHAEGDFLRGARLGYGITQTPQVWLDCQVSERNGSLLINWDVRQGLFAEGLIEAAFSSFHGLLLELAQGPGAWHRTQPLTLPATMAERRQASNATERDLPVRCLHDGFLDSLRAIPDACALICASGHYSYHQLAERANAVAECLRDSGCQPGSPVAIILDKGLEQVAAVLGTLLAGAVYVPVDSGQPDARRDAILDDARIRWVLTDAGQRESRAWPGNVALIAVDSLSPLPFRQLPRHHLCDPANLAYVIYTSGTTGRPKGVMMSHRAAFNTVADINQRFAVDANDRLLGLANLGFDLSVYDLFGTFLAGATLVLPSPAQRSDPAHWASLINRHAVSLWNSVPAQMQMLCSYLDAEPATTPLSLRLAMLSGDWVGVGLPAAIRHHCPALRLISLGGATEAAIWSISHEIHQVPPGTRSIPYGTPLANQRFHVLDSELQTRPDGVAGELYIGGAGLAEGYLNDAARTAERFIHHPHSGERLYRTGDFGRYRSDGLIEFLGREDTQVKLRGHRIELSEIESLLQEHPDVAQAVVVLAGEAQERRLAAFVTPRGLTTATHDSWNAELAACAMDCGERATLGLDRALLAQWVDMANHIALLDMLKTLRGAGLFVDPQACHSIANVQQQCRVAPAHRRLMRRWLKALASEGWLIEDKATASYRLGNAPDERQSAQCWQAMDELEARLHYGTELLRYLRDSSDRLPQLLSGEVDPLALLFPQGRMDTALAAYNDNLLMRCMNQVICACVLQIASTRAHSGRPLRILEVGAGVGGTSRELIPALDGFAVDYLFTDVSAFFLNEAREQFADRPWVRFGLFDINADALGQGLHGSSWDVIVCANVLHNARHAPTVLRNLRELAVPGGHLLVMEATREILSLLTSMEFKEGLDNFTDLRADKDQTFISRHQWQELFEDTGAELVAAWPVAEDPLDCAGQTTFIVRFPCEQVELNREDLLHYLQRCLPSYMLPSYLEVLECMPLSPNGKIDRTCLSARLPGHGSRQMVLGEAPRGDLEQRIAALWSAALGCNDIARDQDFFAAGGDSLLVAQIVARMREQIPESACWEWDRLLREVLREPTVQALATRLQESPDERDDEPASRHSPLNVLAPARSIDCNTVHVLVHDGSGTLAPYRALLGALRNEPARQGAILGLSLPGEADYLARPAAGLIEWLGAEYARYLLDYGVQRFELVGYCMGGLLAIETARGLLEAGAEVGMVSVISSDRFRYQIDDELLLERAFGRLLGATIEAAGHEIEDAVLHRALEHLVKRHGPRLPAGCLQDLDGEWAPVAECYRRLAQCPAEQRLATLASCVPTQAAPLSAVQAHSLFRVFRHSLDAVAGYRPAPFAGNLQVLLDDQSLHFLPGLQGNMRGFWRDLALGDIRLLNINGNHVSCMQPPHVDQLLPVLMGEVS
ncbi:pyochelin synthetase [Pseudomonas delhiensis]|uniref:L-cysteine--[L-cysteinyl-carrier protein] ligase n=1 Tax=Pseudomonas delhiensis TaxID=366289 RepID=A0A239I946_9PSED|nr:non-ribosomal peptide synthetase [Pseudomonas delhiensis]SDK16726.1 pyochelin synthetase [Pseudomonas delhiensis]SNS90031.1 pyochelin synthetase [Pseudomonas delhiensis]